MLNDSGEEPIISVVKIRWQSLKDDQLAATL